MSKLKLSAVIVINGEEKDLLTMKVEERKVIGRQLANNFLKTIGCDVKTA